MVIAGWWPESYPRKFAASNISTLFSCCLIVAACISQA